MAERKNFYEDVKRAANVSPGLPRYDRFIVHRTIGRSPFFGLARRFRAPRRAWRDVLFDPRLVEPTQVSNFGDGKGKFADQLGIYSTNKGKRVVKISLSDPSDYLANFPTSFHLLFLCLMCLYGGTGLRGEGYSE